MTVLDLNSVAMREFSIHLRNVYAMIACSVALARQGTVRCTVPYIVLLHNGKEGNTVVTGSWIDGPWERYKLLNRIHLQYKHIP